MFIHLLSFWTSSSHVSQPTCSLGDSATDWPQLSRLYLKTGTESTSRTVILMLEIIVDVKVNALPNTELSVSTGKIGAQDNKERNVAF